jgi:HPt (histidine-containing phosphotransfer) domain-containing protein
MGENILDSDALLSRVNHDVDLLRDIVGMFRENCPRLMVELREALATKDRAGVHDAASALQNSVSPFSTQMTFEAAGKLDALSQTGDFEAAAAAYQSLELSLQRLRAALEGLAPAVPFA